MSARLASGLIDNARLAASASLGSAGKPAPSWILMDGIDPELAGRLVANWPADLPPIYVAGPPDADFGDADLRTSSATRERNRGSMCLVICEGQRVPDGQSVRGFERCGLELLASAEGARRLARQAPDVTAAEGLAAVLEALDDPKLEAPPSSRALASFLDEVAGGARVPDALPLIGAFRDEAAAGSLSCARIVSNLNLAASRSSVERLSPSSLAEIRERCERQAIPRGAAQPGERVVELLLSRDPAILRQLSFADAIAVLEQAPPSKLDEQVAGDLRRHAAAHPDAAREMKEAEERLKELGDPVRRKEAADALLELDAHHQGAVLGTATRRRLRALRRDRSVSDPAIESGVVRAVETLSSALKAIELREPQLGGSGSSEAALKAIVAVAAAHLRLAPLLRVFEKGGANVAAPLLADPGPKLRGALSQLQGKHASLARVVKLGVRGRDKGDSVEVVWSPSAEDIGAVIATVAFADADPAALALRACAPLEGPALANLQPEPAGGAHAKLEARLKATASAVLREGFDGAALAAWTASWREAVEAAGAAGYRGADLDALAGAGCVRTSSGLIMTALSPLKSEWVADRSAAWLELGRLAAESAAGADVKVPGDTLPPPIAQAARAVGAATAAGYPGFVAVSGGQPPLLPSGSGGLLAAFGDQVLGAKVAEPPIEPIQSALRKLMDLHPEAARHLRCAAWGDAGDLLARAILEEVRRSQRIGVAEIFCVEGAPSSGTLAELDDLARGQAARRIQLRYVERLQDWERVGGGPEVHLALFYGITEGPGRISANIESAPAPPLEEGVLFTPRTWVRPRQSRALLCPPRMSAAGRAWYALMTALIDDDWGAEDLRIPELRTDAAAVAPALREMHNRALWVATLDRYATRETIRQAVGPEVAILHQERRSSGDSVYGMVISQKSGGATDRAISRSLRGSGLLDQTAAEGVAPGLRRAASEGYGILALRAATTGSGINELIGHVAAFHRLTSDASPWPLPAGSRVLLISLDEYAGWFGAGKRADLLALAISPEEGGIHAANFEVKTVKSPIGSARAALAEAREQLRKTILDFRFAAYPQASQLLSSLWLNRIADAAIGICRENDTRLSAEDLAALDNFRRGEGVLEWAGVAMVFTSSPPDPPQHAHIPLMGDRVPIAQVMVRLTPELLAEAATTNGTRLRTTGSRRPLLMSSTKERKSGGLRPTGAAAADESEREMEAGGGSPDPGGRAAETPPAADPVIGWDAATREPVEWRVTGPGALSNGHVEIYGTSGAGKTQFVMSLLTQLRAMGSRFGVCDFKNDYGEPFPSSVGATFYDLWQESLPFNPLAIENPTRRNLQALTIELRDAVDIAARSYARLGHRQLSKLQQAFEEAFEQARQAKQDAPTLGQVHELLDDDLRGVVGDLTGTDLFGDGPPLGSLIGRDAIFGLNRIPGTGVTTTLAAGFILASLYLKILELPQVANKVTYTVVIDEAHRVAHFHSVQSMIRELRSKGLAVILATQTPGELPTAASTNAQTKVYMRLPGAQAARDAARQLDPSDRGLPELIRTLKDGEAMLSLGGGGPRLVILRQFWRDDAGAPP